MVDAVVAAVAQATSPLDTEDDSDAELALQIEKMPGPREILRLLQSALRALESRS